MSGAIFGNAPFKSAKSAVFRGAGASAATSAYVQNHDPRTQCDTSNPFDNSFGYKKVYGYQTMQNTSGNGRFSFGDFFKDVAIGAVTGGLAGAAFYGAGRAVEALKGSVRSRKCNGISLPSEKTQINRLPETKAANAIRSSEVLTRWDEYLGTNTTNIHPLTGRPDSNRIFSADATRSIRVGEHEMKSFGTTKAHFHYEKWDYNAYDDIMTVSNILQRFRD